jgi:polyvinyl alcohol dehydrogenase (cytochrome)
VGEGQKSGVYWALDRATMGPVWEAFTGPGTFVGGIIGSTAYDGQRVYGPDTVGGEIWALDRAGGTAWISSDGDPAHFGPVSTANGVVYSSGMNGLLTAREASTGIVLAKLPLGGPAWGGVSIDRGTVFAVTGIQGDSGFVVAYRPAL